MCAAFLVLTQLSTSPCGQPGMLHDTDERAQKDQLYLKGRGAHTLKLVIALT